MTNRLCFQNLLENGTVVASSEDAAYPVANSFDWITSDYFRPTAGGTINIDLTLSEAASANYFAFFNQNLYSLSGTIKLQWWNGSAYVDCFSAVSPTSNAPSVTFFPQQISTKWRVVITCASVFAISMLSFGTSLDLPYGMYLNWTEPQLANADEYLNSESDSGEFLGTSRISKGIKTTLELQGATDAWIRTNWVPFISRAKPFWFLPNYETYPSEAALCKFDGAPPPPKHSGYGYMSVSIPIRGLIE
ncbi:hypothetical protein ACVIHC_002191 [Bradyrhizobium diazoefficiens]